MVGKSTKKGKMILNKIANFIRLSAFVFMMAFWIGSILLITFLVVVGSSHPGKYQKDLCRYIGRAPSETDTVVIPANFFQRFEWDKMYVIGGDIFSDEEIENIIGMKYQKWLDEDRTLFLFVKNGKIKKEYRAWDGGKCNFVFENRPVQILCTDTLVIYPQHFKNMVKILSCIK